MEDARHRQSEYPGRDNFGISSITDELLDHRPLSFRQVLSADVRAAPGRCGEVLLEVPRSGLSDGAVITLFVIMFARAVLRS
jgi:hypothetical protein